MDFAIGILLTVMGLVAIQIGVDLWLRKKRADRHVLITDGSSGIGLWLAIQAVKMGANVTIIPRDATNLGE